MPDSPNLPTDHTSFKANEDATGEAVGLSHLKFAYSEQDNPVIDIPSWHLAKSEKCFIAGPSGAGKSTLLNLLTGTLAPTEGEITLLGQPFSSLSSRKRDAFRARHIGVVFQQFNLIEYLTVQQNIEAAAYFYKGKAGMTEARQRIPSMLEHLQLSPTIGRKKAATLSVGQRQRVAIARALINRPQLLIADEPTSSLDAQTRDQFMQLLLDIAQDTAVIFVSHDVSLARYFSRHEDIREINAIQGNVQ
ncbi:ATP-binding cassette domain-containing protein [Alteromonas sp. 14N.309.X.WAT.G.H12]|uniref:ATP-binding cassette domain-containing protein n=1 Tax=Alteromonas sp. 14N.309.X.WAT.G.H12 TaxID=3120824 RepID=UPI002FD17EB6